MFYLIPVMAIAGGLASFLVNWRFLLLVSVCLLVGEGIYAWAYADLWNFVRVFVAIAALEVGYVLGGLAPESWREKSLSKAPEGHSLRGKKLRPK